MSPETPIPEPTDSDPALPAEEANSSGSRDIAKSSSSTNEDLSPLEDVLEEDIWESVDMVTNTEPTVSEKVSVEKVAELAAVRASSPKRSRVTSGAPIAATKTTTWQQFQRYWYAEIQPALKEQTIKTLKATIRSLEALVVRLESKPTAGSQQQDNAPSRHRGIWRSVLRLTRSRLPRSLNRKLSDPLLGGAIAAVLLMTLWTSSALIFRQSPTPVAIAPPTRSAPAQPTDSNEKLVPNEQPVAKPTPNMITIDPRPKQTLLTPSEETSDTLVDIAKTVPSPSVTPTPKPTPPPLKLTPEQTLIARIQDQVADVSNQYVNGLIQSVQANFRSSLLTVKVGDDWYTLEQAQQNQLVNEMLKRAQQLNFVKLELTDSESNLLARSPVVGSEMVILQRTTSL